MRDTAEIAKQRRSVLSAKKAPFWAGVNSFFMLLLMIELQFSIFPRFFDQNIVNHVITFLELLLLILCAMNTLYHLYLYIWVKSLMQPIELTSREYQLFGIGNDEIGFVLQKPKAIDNTDDKNASYPKYMPKFEMNNSGSFINSSIDSAAMSRLYDNSLNSTNASWSFHNASGMKNSTFNHSLNKTGNSFNDSANNSELRFRKVNSFALPLSDLRNSSKNAIKSDQELKSFLRSYEEKTEQVSELLQSQKRYGTSAVDGNTSNVSAPNLSNFSQPGNNQSMHTSQNASQHISVNASQNSSQHLSLVSNQTQSPSSQAQEQSNNKSLNNTSFDYQPAIIVFSGTNNSIDKSASVIFNHHNAKDLEKILKILGVKETSLSHMVENIRRWISQTILTRLSEQIDAVNNQITSKGYIEGIVGETPIQALKAFAQSKEKEFPNLMQIYSFMNLQSKVSENSAVIQRYLVRRIKDMSKGGCISDYVWNGGATYNYKPWKDDFHTDAELLLHLFAVYMDSRILFNPALPEGKPFTSQFLKLSASATPKSDTYIEQTSASPPHYRVVLRKEEFDLPGGRNNLFYALLVFINHIQTKHFGLLGRINLSASGLNISWVINDALKH